MTDQRRKRPRDPAQLAKFVIDVATGEVEDRPPTPKERGKDPNASAMGKKGGAARASKLSKEHRVTIATGKACDDYHHWRVKGLKSQRVQVDEIWSFVYRKAATKAKNHVEGSGDCWTWTAIDADSKFLISYYIGTRHSGQRSFS